MMSTCCEKFDKGVKTINEVQWQVGEPFQGRSFQSGREGLAHDDNIN